MEEEYEVSPCGTIILHEGGVLYEFCTVDEAPLMCRLLNMGHGRLGWEYEGQGPRSSGPYYLFLEDALDDEGLVEEASRAVIERMVTD